MSRNSTNEPVVTTQAPAPAYVVLGDGLIVSAAEFQKDPRAWLSRD